MVEWSDERSVVSEGMAFLILPGVWHRYRPNPERGWTEDWCELRGDMVDLWVEKGVFQDRVFRPETDCFRRMADLHQCVHDPQSSPAAKAALAMAVLAGVVYHVADPRARRKKTYKLDKMSKARKLLAEGSTVVDVAKQVGCSPPTLNRLFHELMGISPKAYAQQIRFSRSEALLAGGGLSIKEIAAELGFNSPNHFSAQFKHLYGISPQHWRENLHASPLPPELGRTRFS